MPPTFLIFVMLVIWVSFACIVWTAALVMLLSAKTRRFSKPLCWAMAGTFPFVLAYQILAALPVGIVLLSGWTFWKLLEPGTSSSTSNPVVIAVSICVAFIAFATMLMTSLAGFYDGWRTGWKWGHGQNFRNALLEAPAYRRLSGCIRATTSKRNQTKP
jgi:hypothetical protein